MTAATLLRLHPDDPVAITRGGLEPGSAASVPGGPELRVAEAVPAGHKVSLVEIPAGAVVTKYGQPIGVATVEVAPGRHVHTHNLVSLSASAGPGRAAPGTAGAATARPGAKARPAPGGPASFQGIVRPDGRVGTRNYVAVLSSVNCSATVVRRIVSAFQAPGALEGRPDIDGVIALTHGGGCGTAASGEGLAVLRRTLAGYARHPNVAGVVVLGLGCEVNQVDELVEEMALPPDVPLRAATIQGEGGTRAAIEWGVSEVRGMIEALAPAERRTVPASELVLGLQCGGSDAWSGVTANPVLGVASDLLVAAGGTAVLAETPEIHGAEHLLTARATTPEVARALEERVAWWEAYARAGGTTLDGNPSPGNRAGGITTIEEKSLGAVAKGGSSALVEVVGYAEAVRAKGLVFMDTPGYDPVSVTGLVAGGANLVCFTTGRGSVFGCKPAPSLKLATTSELYRRMPEDMDLDCGQVLEGTTSVEQLGAELFTRVLSVASGEHTKSEDLGLGDEELVAWQLGAVL
ncbi:MAG: altronate dehydratase family protein [Actinomycetota bacterium]|nr:altronate dehydratase family protein [Actinomycetota bacterium]